MARTLIARLLLLLAVCISPVALAYGQNETREANIDALRPQVDSRFQVFPLSDGIALVPRFKTGVKMVEVGDKTIAVDGQVVTGAELREKLGADADLVLQLSYLDSGARRALAGDSVLPQVQQPPPDERPSRAERRNRSRNRDSLVRFGGNVNVPADERVTDDVVVIGGSATIDGHVDGDLVVVGGAATLGPASEVQGDVTVVGGALKRDPNAVVGGSVQEVSVEGLGLGREWIRGMPLGWNPMSTIFPFARFAGTAARVGLMMLLAALVLLVARTPVERIADRAAAEPVKAWIIGFLAELFFIPMLVLTILVLIVSIVGIPLLVLVPVLMVAACIAAVVGFTGVAYQVGRILQDRFDGLRSRPYLSTFAGIVAIVSPLILARILGLVGVAQILAGALVAGSLVLEYIAWTTGIGAAALARFGGPLPPVQSSHQTAVVMNPEP